MNMNEKYFLNSLRYASCHAALSFRYATLGAYNKGYAVRGSAHPSPKFCSVSLRKTSNIPDVENDNKKCITNRCTGFLLRCAP
jgi:hypothetical protein